MPLTLETTTAPVEIIAASLPRTAGAALPAAATVVLRFAPGAVPAAPLAPARSRVRLSRSSVWHLAGVLILMASSAAYAIYALLHMGTF